MHSRRTCLLSSLLVLLILFLTIVGSWFFFLRPYLQGRAEQQIDRVLSEAVNLIPSQAAQLPPGPIPIYEEPINMLIALHTKPSDIIQHFQVHSTREGVHTDFQLYGYNCAVNAVLGVQQGHLIVTRLTLGIVFLIMSPDELTARLNKHLADAQTRLNHPILAVSTQDNQIILTLGTGNGSLPIPPTIPPMPMP